MGVLPAGILLQLLALHHGAQSVGKPPAGRSGRRPKTWGPSSWSWPTATTTLKHPGTTRGCCSPAVLLLYLVPEDRSLLAVHGFSTTVSQKVGPLGGAVPVSGHGIQSARSSGATVR